MLFCLCIFEANAYILELKEKKNAWICVGTGNVGLFNFHFQRYQIFGTLSACAKSSLQQECIPVGCVPAARRPYGGVCFPEGGSPWSGGVSLVWGVCLVRGGSTWSGGFSLVWGGLPGPGGSPWSGGVLPAGGVFSLVWGGPPCRGGSPWSRGGVCLVRGGSPETPPVNRITDTCKNITLATTSLRPVKIK